MNKQKRNTDISRYRNDRVAFCEDVMNCRLTRQQREMLQTGAMGGSTIGGALGSKPFSSSTYGADFTKVSNNEHD